MSLPLTERMTKVITYTATIYAGLQEGYGGRVHDSHEALCICNAYCDHVGLCVSLTDTWFCYRDGSEPGVIVGLINYCRFPSEPAIIRQHALELARRLKDAFAQTRVSVVFPDETVMLG